MQTQLEHRAFLLLLAVVSVAFFWLLLPFYGAVFWAVILAIVFQPLQRNFEYRFGSRSNLAAFLSVMVCIVIAIIPMTLIVGALIREGTELVGQVQSGAIDPSSILGNLQEALPPWAQHWFDRLGVGNLELDARAAGRAAPAGEPGDRRQGAQHRPGHAAGSSSAPGSCSTCSSSSSATGG